MPAICCHRFWRGLFFLIVPLVALGWPGAVRGEGDERIWMDVLINNKRAHLAFDTGAGGLVLFSKGAARLGLSYTNAPKNVQLAPGEVPVGITEPCDIAMGTNHARTGVMVLDMPTMLNPMEDGVIGWGSVRSNIVQIDARLGSVTWLSELPTKLEGWTQCHLRTNVDTVQLEWASPTPSRILFDTGSAAGVELTRETWRSWTAAHKRQPRTLRAYYLPHAGLVVAEEAWVQEFSFGRFSLSEIPIMGANGKNDLPDITATFGLGALKRMDLIIDGTKGIAYVRPLKTSAPPYPHNRLGAVFTPADLKTSDDLIARVIEGSPAHQAGIRTGDLLLKIDELDVTPWRTDPKVLPLSRFWVRPAGTKLDLALKRGDEKLKVSVVLREILGPDKKPAK